MAGGCTGNGFVCKLQIGPVSKLGQGESSPYRTSRANTFSGGPVAGICKLQMHVVRGVEAMETSERALDGEAEVAVVHVLMLNAVRNDLVRKKTRRETAELSG